MKHISFVYLSAALLFSSIYSVVTAQSQSTPLRVIRADCTQPAGKFNPMFKACIGAGRANEGLRADWQQQLAETKKECDFKYIRMHGLLTDDMAVYRESRDGKPEYNFMYIDALYDYLLSIGVKPFVELGFMPSALASGNQTIFWWRGNVTPPKDYDKWKGLIKALTEHFTERYGVEEVKTWYFEVWNEPNLKGGFWTGTQEEYFKLYSYAAEAVKSVNKAYKVGGPATAGAAWVPETIEYCAQNKVPIDFISTHSYGVNQGYLDEYGNSGTVLSKDPLSVSRDILNSQAQIRKSAYPSLELHYTEWSASYTPSDPIHDSYHEAPYILEKIKQVGTAANSMSYWVFTDIFEEAGPRFIPFHGGFGLMNIQGIKKPAYFAYAFLNKLGNVELQNSDSASWVCKSANGNVQALFWNRSYTLPDSVNNQAYYVRDLPSKAVGNTEVRISGLKPGKYRVETYQTGYRVNDAYTDYVDLKCPAQLTRSQVARIKEKNSGKPVTVEVITVTQTGSYTKKVAMRENDVFLLNLIKL